MTRAPAAQPTAAAAPAPRAKGGKGGRKSGGPAQNSPANTRAQIRSAEVEGSPAFSGQLQVEYRAIDSLKAYAKNARTHSEAQVAQIARAIAEFGWTNPLLIDESGELIAGHGRLAAAASLGMQSLPCIVLRGLTPAQRRAYVIADNKLALNGGWNAELLGLEMADLKSLGFELDLVGFSADELAGMSPFSDAAAQPGLVEDDVIPEIQRDPVTTKGDVWLLGPHRILCGDCREPFDMARLLAGTRKINVAMTSPPYASQREYDASSGFLPIPPDEYVEWFAPIASNVAAALADDGSWFVNIKPAADGLDTSLYVFDLVLAHVRRWGWHFATEYCWERSGIPKRVVRRFKNQFEPVYQFTRGDWKMRPDTVRHPSKAVPKARGKGVGATTWGAHQGGGIDWIQMSGNQGRPGFEWFGDEIEEGMAYPGNRLPTFSSSHTATGHSAAFPVGLPEFFVLAYSDPGDVVFDPFMGSGSTLIAAEKTGRTGLGTEISPLYCDVIVRRWQAFTGKQAVLESTGAAFDTMADQRIAA